MLSKSNVYGGLWTSDEGQAAGAHELPSLNLGGLWQPPGSQASSSW